MAIDRMHLVEKLKERNRSYSEEIVMQAVLLFYSPNSHRIAFSALMLLVRWQEGHPACKNEWWGAGVLICLERGAGLHIAQLLPLPCAVSCFSKIQIGFTFLLPAHPGGPGQRAIKRMCV